MTISDERLRAILSANSPDDDQEDLLIIRELLALRGAPTGAEGDKP